MSCSAPTSSGASRRAFELGQSEADWQKAFQLYQKFDLAKGVADITATVSALRELDAVQGQGRRARLLPRRQARLSRGGARRGRLRGLLLRRRHRDLAGPRARHQMPGGHAFRREGPVRPAGRRRADQGGLRRAAGDRDLRLSRRRSRLQPHRRRALRQAGGLDGAFALDRAAAPGDGAALRSQPPCGTSTRSTSSAPAMSRRP